MVRLSVLSSAAAVVSSAAYFASATPVPSNQELKAAVIPFAKRQVGDATEARKRDLRRIQRRSEHIAGLRESGQLAKRALPAVAALPPYDIGAVRRSSKGKRQASYTNPLTNSKDNVWFGPTDIGTPAQTITIDFDTGSSDLVVPTTDCKNCTAPFFDPSKSTSFSTSNTPFQTGFGDGSTAAGVVATDVVAIGQLSVPTQTFAVIEQAAVGFDNPNAGLMGLAFPAIAASKANPWFINLAQGGALSSNLFSFYLTKGGADGSELCIGCTDSTKFTGDPEYFPLVAGSSGSQEMWTIASQGLIYNNQVVTQSIVAVIDSGTTLIAIPPSYLSTFYAGISGAKTAADGSYVIPCDTSSLAPFGLKFSSDTIYNIDPSHLATDKVGDGMCSGAVVSSGQEDGQAIVGDVFMSTWYSIFDYGNMRVGFAQAT